MDIKVIKELIYETVSDMVHVGEVVSTNPGNCTARVKLSDRDDFITSELQVRQAKTHKDQFYFMPDIGEMVICVFLGNGADAGFIIGSAYNRQDKPVYSGQNMAYVKFEDDTEFVYDKDKSQLYMNVEGDVDIDVKEAVTLETPEVLVKADNVEITGDTTSINCTKVNLGNGANAKVVHQYTLCPIFGVPIGSINPSTVTHTAQ